MDNTTVSMIRAIYFIKQLNQSTVHALQWRHNEPDAVSNHQPHDCLLNRLFGHRSNKISKFRVVGLCAGNSSEAGEFPAQMASNAENVSIWWRAGLNAASYIFECCVHHGWRKFCLYAISRNIETSKL